MATNPFATQDDYIKALAAATAAEIKGHTEGPRVLQILAMTLARLALEKTSPAQIESFVNQVRAGLAASTSQGRIVTGAQVSNQTKDTFENALALIKKK
jgi:hypothetical protein